jgi:hypothetical protein
MSATYTFIVDVTKTYRVKVEADDPEKAFDEAQESGGTWEEIDINIHYESEDN